MTAPGITSPTTPGRPLALFAVGYGLMHHGGTLFTGLGAMPSGGSVATTRWADWLDLFTPLAVLAPLAWALVLARGGVVARRAVAAVGGAVTYVEGHGIHLAANSIGNVAPGATAHLWDEVVGHYLMAFGLTVLLAVTATQLGRVVELPDRRVAGPLGLVVGFTWATNALEGGTAVLSAAVAAGFALWGWRLRGRMGEVLLWAFGPALVIVLVYGAIHGGFPQPSTVDGGWP